MINAKLIIRCISPEALESIVELLKDEANAIWVESWETKENPRTGTPAVIVTPNWSHGLGTTAGNKRRVSRATRGGS
jgi:hypothetical protein